MFHGIQIEKGGRIVKTSRNLRGLLDYARVSPVARIEAIELPKEAGSMRVIFDNGASTRANFESYKVMRAWIKSRKSWAGFKLFVNGEPA